MELTDYKVEMRLGLRYDLDMANVVCRIRVGDQDFVSTQLGTTTRMNTTTPERMEVLLLGEALVDIGQMMRKQILEGKPHPRLMKDRTGTSGI